MKKKSDMWYSLISLFIGLFPFIIIGSIVFFNVESAKETNRLCGADGCYYFVYNTDKTKIKCIDCYEIDEFGQRNYSAYPEEFVIDLKDEVD